MKNNQITDATALHDITCWSSQKKTSSLANHTN